MAVAAAAKGARCVQGRSRHVQSWLCVWWRRVVTRGWPCGGQQALVGVLPSCWSDLEAVMQHSSTVDGDSTAACRSAAAQALIGVTCHCVWTAAVTLPSQQVVLHEGLWHPLLLDNRPYQIPYHHTPARPHTPCTWNFAGVAMVCASIPGEPGSIRATTLRKGEGLACLPPVACQVMRPATTG